MRVRFLNSTVPSALFRNSIGAGQVSQPTTRRPDCPKHSSLHVAPRANSLGQRRIHALNNFVDLLGLLTVHPARRETGLSRRRWKHRGPTRRYWRHLSVIQGEWRLLKSEVA